MFCNLSRPVSTWICRIVLELYAVSLLAPGCSFTTDESRHRPRCGQSRKDGEMISLVSDITSRLLGGFKRPAQCNQMLGLTSQCDTVSRQIKRSQNVSVWCCFIEGKRSLVFFTGHCLAVRLATNTEKGTERQMYFFIFFLQGTGQYPKLWTSFINIIFRHVIIIMEALFKPGHNLLLYGCSEGENCVEKKRVHGESILPGDFKSLA